MTNRLAITGDVAEGRDAGISHNSSSSSYQEDQQHFGDGAMLPGSMAEEPDNGIRLSATTNLRHDVAKLKEMQTPPARLDRAQSTFSMSSSRAATPDGLRELKEEQAGGVVITQVETPEWIELILAATGISYLTYRIGQERERRAEAYYINPFPTTFSLVTSMKFEVVVACAIIVNCVLIGWEASNEDGYLEGFFSACEHMFVVFFFVEWCLRVMAFGWVWIFELLNFCDTVLVFGTGVLFKWVMEPLEFDISYLRIFTVLRALRLARLAKSVRLMPFFKELWILIHGLTNSARPLLWTFVIALIILYVFAVAATELIGRREVFMQHPNVQERLHIQERFGNLLRSTFTMFQLMTMDTWGIDIARPVMDIDPGLSVLFIAFIGIAVFIFWNLITAIIVENAFSMASEDSAHQAKEVELAKKRELKVLADLFLEIDKDGSGELTEDEFWGALKNKKVKQMIDLMELKPGELEEVWKTLDDGDGVLTIKEFTNGIRRMKGEAKAKDVIDTVKRLRHTSLGLTELRAQVDQFGSTLTSLESDLHRISKDTGEVVGLLQEMYHRLTVHVERTERADQIRLKQKARAARLQEIAAANAEAQKEEEDEDAE